MMNADRTNFVIISSRYRDKLNYRSILIGNNIITANSHVCNLVWLCNTLYWCEAYYNWDSWAVVYIKNLGKATQTMVYGILFVKSSLTNTNVCTYLKIIIYPIGTNMTTYHQLSRGCIDKCIIFKMIFNFQTLVWPITWIPILCNVYIHMIRK